MSEFVGAWRRAGVRAVNSCLPAMCCKVFQGNGELVEDWSKAQNSARLVPGLLGAAGKALAGHRFTKWSFRALKALLDVSGAASGLKFTTDP